MSRSRIPNYCNILEALGWSPGAMRVDVAEDLHIRARTPRDLVSGLAAGPGKGRSGHWLGTSRWVVPGENPETHSGILLTAQLEKGNSGRVEKLVAQGRRVPMERPLHGPTAGLLANHYVGVGVWLPSPRHHICCVPAVIHHDCWAVCLV